MANTSGRPVRKPVRPTQVPTPVRAVPSAAAPSTPQVVEAAVRVMTICVPEELTTEVLNSTRQLDRHFGVAATTCPRLWASSSLHVWQRNQLVDLRKGRPAYCAGGPIRLLDLAGMRYGASVGAAIRHQHWSHLVHGLKAAQPWRVFMQWHLTDPSTYPMDAMRTAFDNQPQVVAMRMHNAATYGAAHLDVGELEQFQAGQMAYQNYHALWSVCTDALQTVEGVQHKPASASFADAVTYLGHAYRYIESLDGSQRLITVTL